MHSTVGSQMPDQMEEIDADALNLLAGCFYARGIKDWAKAKYYT